LRFFIGYWINTGWIFIRPFFMLSNPVARVVFKLFL
jgi:hypothetical protein